MATISVTQDDFITVNGQTISVARILELIGSTSPARDDNLKATSEWLWEVWGETDDNRNPRRSLPDGRNLLWVMDTLCMQEGDEVKGMIAAPTRGQVRELCEQYGAPIS